MNAHAHDRDCGRRGCIATTRVCLANQVGGEEAAEKPFLDERRCTSEANEKMVLEPLTYLSDTL
jgi:hypothetical protein